MTTEDIKTRLAEIDARREKAIEGPYFVSHDDASDSPDHANSGLAKVDTGRTADWWIARLCEWHTAAFLAESWSDIGFLREVVDRLMEENDRLKRARRNDLGTFERIASSLGMESFCCGAETVELESQAMRIGAEIERLRKENAEAWEQAISIVENTWATTSVGKVTTENQSEYERNRVIAALRTKQESK